MENYELLLTQQAEDNIQDSLDTLLTAARDIASASENDFERIKSKKWYKRLWELVTFNNDNQMIQARGVGNLAKLNEITMKAIILVSKQSQDIATNVAESLKELSALKEDVDDLYDQQNKLIETVLKIKRGFEVEERFDELSENQRNIIFAVLYKYAANQPSTEDTGKLLATIRRNSHDTYESVDYAIIESELTKNSQKVLFSILHLYSFLLNATPLDEKHELFHFIGLSENIKNIIRNRVQEDIKVLGKEQCIKMFDCATEEYNTYIDADGIEWVLNDEETFETNIVIEEKETNKTKETFDIVFSTVLRHIGNVFLEENSKEKRESQAKRKKKYLEKFVPHVVPKTVIAVSGLSGSEHYIFTTCGLHIHRSFWNDCRFIKYSDIDTTLSTIDYKKNILRIINKEGEEFFSIDSSAMFFNCSAFLTLIEELKKIPCSDTDTVTAITEMEERTKLLYGKALVCFCQLCGYSVVDALRLTLDLQISDLAWKELSSYAEHPSISDYDSILLNLKHSFPFPSEESGCYSFLQDAVVLLQYCTGKTREVTGNEDKAIRHTAEVLGIPFTLLDALVPAAQINYRILKKDITKKEMDKLSKAFLTAAGAVGIPVVMVLGSNTLFLHTLWFWFIPGIGAVIGTAFAGTAAALVLIKKNKSDKEKMDKAYNALWDYVCDSYKSAYQCFLAASTEKTQEWGQELLLSAERIDGNLKDLLFEE